MKRIWIVALSLCVMGLVGGCDKAGPTRPIALDTAIVSGVVRDAHGVPVPFAMVWSLDAYTTWADEQGAYRLVVESPGPTVSVKAVDRTSRDEVIVGTAWGEVVVRVLAPEVHADIVLDQSQPI